MYVSDLACDLRNAGWRDTDVRYGDGSLMICEWRRDDRRIWAVVDATTNVIMDTNLRVNR